MFEPEYYHLSFSIVLLIILIVHCCSICFNYNKLFVFGGKYTSFLLSVVCVIIIGCRDWTSVDYFGDSIRYGYSFINDYQDYNLSDFKDVGFSCYTLLIYSLGFSVEFYFFLCSMLYVFPLYFAAKKISVNFCFSILLMVVMSFSFYSYGVNGIRNGIATSLLLLSFSYRSNIVIMIFLMMIAISVHKSVMLTSFIFIFVLFYNRPALYLKIWCFCVGLSFFLGTYIKNYTMSISFLNDRVDGYFSNSAELGLFSKVGFRWDFLLYSSLPVFVGVYYIYKRHFNDKFYLQLFSTYLLTNAFWIMINDVPFSNRFAYLSWFIMPVVFIYPILYIEREKIIILSMIFYSALTIILNNV